MKINTYEEKDYEAKKEKLRIRVSAEYADTFKRWRADIDGPWYDDSNPQGKGDTEKEAIANALESLRELYEEVGRFLADCKREVQ